MNDPRPTSMRSTSNIGVSVQNDAPRAVKNIVSTLRTNLALSLYFLFMGSVVLYNGQLIKFTGDRSFEYVNYVIYLSAPISIVVGLLLMEITAVFASVILFSFFCYLLIIGANLSPLGFQNYQLVVFIPILYVPIIAYLFRRGAFQGVYVATAVIVLLYCGAYDYLSLTVHASSEMKQTGAGFIAASGERDSRIALEAVATLICLFLGLAGLKSKTNLLLSLLMVVLAVAALTLSRSRTIEANALIFSTVYITMGLNRFISGAVSTAVILSTLAFTSFFFYDYNAYEHFANGDLSVTTRAIELEHARPWIRDHLISGVGFVNPLGLGPNATYDGKRDVLWNDLGIYGVLYVGGLIGAIVYTAMNLMLVAAQRSFLRIRMPRTIREGLGMAGMCVAATSVAVPTAWGAGLELFAMAFAAYAVSLGRQNRSVLSTR